MDKVWVFRQPPFLIEQFNDKEFINNQLWANESFAMPWGWTVSLSIDPTSFLMKQNRLFPIMGKPIRGRGSQGVKVCYFFEKLNHHLQSLSEYSSSVMLEEFLSREEATIIVMPLAAKVSRYRAIPIITCFNHDHSIVSYNGVVAVTVNSWAIY